MGKKKLEETVKLPQHKHCPECAKAILDQDYCSEKCKDLFEKRLFKKKLLIYLQVGAAAFLILLMLFIYSGQLPF